MQDKLAELIKTVKAEIAFGKKKHKRCNAARADRLFSVSPYGFKRLKYS